MRAWAPKRLFRDVSWFLVAGLAAAVVQYGSLLLFAELADLDPVLGSFLAFVAGGVASYLLNHRFTFNATSRHSEAAPRFFFLAGLGLVLNTLLMALLVKVLGLHYLPSQIFTTGVLMVWNFVAYRIFAFR
ncbi:putative flippase GtrA [Constrictibacter sp. MBR-5]|jgi:putative flippase GtrA|uniref:GtrA family protein n=1 Tax=Constrictibacter sp. MBR-5 TaxID=3156467 RepID=UPI003397CE3E